MIKPDNPRQLAIDLLDRSECAVQVAAVIADRNGIFGWGWNNVGAGFGEHAERAALRRTRNVRRTVGASIYVAARRKKSGNTITAKPCEDCHNFIIGNWIDDIHYRDGDGEWRAT